MVFSRDKMNAIQGGGATTYRNPAALHDSLIDPGGSPYSFSGAESHGNADVPLSTCVRAQMLLNCESRRPHFYIFVTIMTESLAPLGQLRQPHPTTAKTLGT